MWKSNIQKREHKEQISTRNNDSRELLIAETYSAPVAISYHKTLAQRMCVFLYVPRNAVQHVVHEALLAASMMTPEHPDVRVIRTVWHASQRLYSRQSLKYQTFDHGDNIAFFSVKDPTIRMMIMLRSVDHVPYETLSAVWHIYTPDRIREQVMQEFYRLFCIAQYKSTVPQSEFMQVLRSIDVQMTAIQLEHMRGGIAHSAESILEFYTNIVQHAASATDQNEDPQTAVLPLSTQQSFDVALTRNSKEEVQKINGKKINKKPQTFLRKCIAFILLILATGLIVFGILWIMSGVEVDADIAVSQSISKRTQQKPVVQEERSLEEIVQSLEQLRQISVDDTKTVFLERDDTFDLLEDDLAYAQTLAKNIRE